MKRNLYLVFIIAAGLCGAALRCICLLHGYEADSGLPKEGYLPSLLLAGLTIAVIVLAIALSRAWFGACRQQGFEQLFGNAKGLTWLITLFMGIWIMLESVNSLLLLPDQIAEQFMMEGSVVVMPSRMMAGATALVWVLSLVSGLCMVLFAVWQHSGKPATKRTGLLATLPILWGCIDLIMVYHENSGNPVLSDYSYTLLLIIAVMLTFYSIGGFLYSGKSPAVRFFASAGIAVYLALMQMGGTSIWSLIETDGIGIAQLLGTSAAMRMHIYFSLAIYLMLQLGNAAIRSQRDTTT